MIQMTLLVLSDGALPWLATNTSVQELLRRWRQSPNGCLCEPQCKWVRWNCGTYAVIVIHTFWLVRWWHGCENWVRKFWKLFTLLVRSFEQKMKS